MVALVIVVVVSLLLLVEDTTVVFFLFGGIGPSSGWIFLFSGGNGSGSRYFLQEVVQVAIFFTICTLII